MSDDSVTISAAELADLRLAADRYRWIRQRAVRLQGNSTSYSGHDCDASNGTLPTTHPGEAGQEYYDGQARRD